MTDINNHWYTKYTSTYPKIGGVLRHRNELSFKALAKDFEGIKSMSLKSLKRYEHGINNCPASVIRTLSSYYECQIGELFDDDTFLGRDYNQTINSFRFSSVNYKDTPKGPRFTDDVDFQGYRLDYGLRLNRYIYDMITLENDHKGIELPKGAKILFRHPSDEDWSKILNDQDKIFIVTLETKDIENFPKNHDKKGKPITFITKARLIGDTQTKIVLYTYDGVIKHIHYQLFKRNIIGIAEKVIIDLL